MTAPWKENLVNINKYSRPGFRLLGVKGIVVHWTATPGASDENEQKFFDGPDGGGGRYAGAHLFIDRDSATLTIPLREVAYHANEKACKIEKLKATAVYYHGGGANLTTIGIELCVEKDGTIHPETVARAVKVVAYICKMYKVPTSDIYRHFDITGKNCPAPWVKDEALFVKFKNDVAKELKPKTPVAVKVPVLKALLREGSKSEQVKVVQSKLKLKADGIFGPATKRAVKAFQTKNKLSADGIVGQATWNKLHK